MKVIHGLSLVSGEGLDITFEAEALPANADDRRAFVEVAGDNFAVDCSLPRRQCRELRDWLTAILDD